MSTASFFMHLFPAIRFSLHTKLAVH